MSLHRNSYCRVLLLLVSSGFTYPSAVNQLYEQAGSCRLISGFCPLSPSLCAGVSSARSSVEPLTGYQVEICARPGTSPVRGKIPFTITSFPSIHLTLELFFLILKLL